MVVPKRWTVNWSWTVFRVSVLKMEKVSVYFRCWWKGSRRGEGNNGQVLFSRVAENYRAPRGWGAETEYMCRWPCQVVVKLREYEGFYFPCEVGARFSAVNKERCGRMNGLRKMQKVWNSYCVEWRGATSTVLCFGHGEFAFIGTTSMWADGLELKLQFKIRYKIWDC